MGFLPSCSSVNAAEWIQHREAKKEIEKKLDEICTRMLHALEQVVGTIPHKIVDVWA